MRTVMIRHELKIAFRYGMRNSTPDAIRRAKRVGGAREIDPVNLCPDVVRYG